MILARGIRTVMLFAAIGACSVAPGDGIDANDGWLLLVSPEGSVSAVGIEGDLVSLRVPAQLLKGPVDFSTDGSMIVYEKGSRIHVASSDGSDARVVTTERIYGLAAFSPDARIILATRNGRGDLGQERDVLLERLVQIPVDGGPVRLDPRFPPVRSWWGLDWRDETVAAIGEAPDGSKRLWVVRSGEAHARAEYMWPYGWDAQVAVVTGGGIIVTSVPPWCDDTRYPQLTALPDPDTERPYPSEDPFGRAAPKASLDGTTVAYVRAPSAGVHEDCRAADLDTVELAVAPAGGGGEVVLDAEGSLTPLDWVESIDLMR